MYIDWNTFMQIPFTFVWKEEITQRLTIWSRQSPLALCFLVFARIFFFSHILLATDNFMYLWSRKLNTLSSDYALNCLLVTNPIQQNFRVVQIQIPCRWHFKVSVYWKIRIWKGRVHCGKNKKLLVDLTIKFFIFRDVFSFSLPKQVIVWERVKLIQGGR